MTSVTSTLTGTPPGLGLQQSAAQVSATTPSNTTATSSAADWRKNAEQALTTLKEVASQSGRKAAANVDAEQKLAQLKAQLKNLMMFGGDPKTRAKEAARIAKEIGDAAKDYAQAGGRSANTATAPSSNAPPSDPASNAAPADLSAADVSAKSNSGPQAAPASAPQARPSGQTAASSSRSADQSFITEARLLAGQAKAMLQSAIGTAARNKEKIGNNAEGDKALGEIDIAAFILGLGRGVGDDASVGYGASAQSLAAAPAPAVTATA